jgi:hypothetical protein
MCTLEQIQTDLCTSGIGEVNDPVTLLQIIAQLTAELLVTQDAGAVITPEAILERACTSGIGKVNDQKTLLQIIAQNGCEIAAA